MSPIRIGLVLQHTLNFYREILLGVRDYGRQRPKWVFVPIEPDSRSLRARRARECAGFICHISSSTLANTIESLGIPFVNVSSVLPSGPLPRIMVDHHRVGSMAADYFLERQFRTLTFAGVRGQLFSMQRREGFERRVQDAGGRVEPCFETKYAQVDPSGLQRSDPKLSAWLSRLPKPVAVFAANDVQGFQVAECCRELGISVPEELSLLAVDNDDLLCELARPALSSIVLPTHQIGLNAAVLLDRLMSGHGSRAAPQPLAPLGIAERASTIFVAIDDELVVRALRFIRENSHRMFSVSDMARELAVSRRMLERRFLAHRHRTLGDEIRRVHLDRAKQLLAETELSIAEVAGTSGFSESKHLATVFRKSEGTTPTQYRRRFRATR